MKLFLASTIKNEKTVKALKKFIPDLSKKKMVYIPTASNAEEYFGSWKRKGKTTYNITKTLNHDLEVLELEFVTDKEAQEKVKIAEILFMAGGFPGYLSYWLYRRKLVQLIKQRLQKDLIYVGISAGAMVCGKTFKVISLLDGESLGDMIPGMGIVDYEIFPHYENSHEKKLKERFANLKIKRLRDGEQIIIDDYI